MNFSALQHSAFLQSLGWAIANNLWQAATLWIVYQLIQFSYKNASSRFRNNLSTGLLFAIFVCFLLTFFNRYFSHVPGVTIHSLSPDGNQYIVPDKIDWSLSFDKVFRILPFLSIAYLLLLATFSIRLINSYLHIYFIKNYGLTKPPVEWRLFTNKVSLQLGITKKIKVWFSEHVDVPATIGFIKPLILIPIASLNQLSTEQVEAIILHELSHIRRNDYLVNLVISIIETILFFNPFVVLLGRIIKSERENCCDDFVIQYQYDRHSYATALLYLEQKRSKNVRLTIAASTGQNQLLKRVQRIMGSGNSDNINYGQKLIALLLITGIICSMAWLSPAKKSTVAKAVPVVEKPAIVTSHKPGKLPGKKNMAAATPAIKVTPIKSIPPKIREAIQDEVAADDNTEDTLANSFVSKRKDFSELQNTMNEDLADQLGMNEEVLLKNKLILSKSKEGYKSIPKLNPHDASLAEIFQRFNKKPLDAFIHNFSAQLNVEQLKKVEAEIRKAFDNVQWKKTSEQMGNLWNQHQLEQLMTQFKLRINTKMKRSLEMGRINIDSILKHSSSLNKYYSNNFETPGRKVPHELDPRERNFLSLRNEGARLENFSPHTIELNNGVLIVSDGNRRIEIQLNNR